MLSYIDIRTGHISKNPLGKGTAGNMSHELLWRAKSSSQAVHFRSKLSSINFRLPLNFKHATVEALSHMVAFASRNMPQPHLWWSELESKGLKILSFTKKADSICKDTQTDKDEILKPTQTNHKFKNKILPSGIQAAIW